MKKTLLLVSLACALTVRAAWAFSPFTVEDIRVEGLERISLGTVLTYLPLDVGDQLDESLSAEVIRALYRTNFFEDVQLERENGALVIRVEERPAINSVDISGNKAIRTDQLREALKQIGLAEGRVFDRSILDNVEQELERQYFSLGQYAVRIESSVTPLERNRVDVTLDIAEGPPARIQQINIVGNEAFDDEELLRRFQSGTRGTFALFSRRDQYSRQKLAGDLETLRSHYLDRGYINFSINSTQVSITPDKSEVYITINISEGEQYRIKDVRVAGDLIVPEEELLGLIDIEPGQLFSRRAAADVTTRIVDRLGIEGYAYANVNPVPDIAEDSREVSLTFFVDPGRRMYVRRINFSGNSKTRDEVLRREMRQMEGAPLSTERVQRSRVRLDRLGFFDEVNVDTAAVPGEPDMVDVNYSVIERPTGTIMAGIGYSEQQGALFNLGVSQENFLGTGKRLALNLDNSEVNTVYSLNYTNPYYTMDGISRTLRVFYRETDAEQASVSAYATDVYGAGVAYGIPVTEHDTLRLGFDYENTTLNPTARTTAHIFDFIDTYGNEFDTFKILGSWTRDRRNRLIFADSGTLNSLSLESALPGGDLEYYKLRFRHQTYIPVWRQLSVLLNGDMGYGDGFGDTDRLPPFEFYYAGGSNTVRGYRGNSLGPRDENNNPTGGRARVVGNLELIFPAPFARENRSVRMSTFFDAGNVFGVGEKIDLGDLRYSAGIGMIWLSPVGALRFSYAWPLNAEPGDDTQRFQFTLGAPF